MLIEMDGSAIDDVLAGSERSRECIENFLHAHQAGRHVVWLDRAQVRALRAIGEELSSRARNALHRLPSQEAEIRGLRNRVRWRLKVGRGPAFSGATVTQEGKEIVHADLHHFHDEERSGRSVLLGENLTDVALYLAMGKAFAATLRWRTRPQYDERGGGGSTIAPAFARLVADGRLVLAIADSDRSHPGGPMGGTAANLEAVARSAFQHVHVLHVRFAENLITSAVYQEAIGDPHNGLPPRVRQDKRAALDALKLKEAMPSARAWRDHAELKRGIKLFHVRALAAGSSEEMFWSDVAVDLQCHQCGQAQACASRDDCRCYVTDPLGGNALELAVAWLTRNDPRRNARLLRIETSAPIRDLCEKILAWGLALAARPT